MQDFIESHCARSGSMRLSDLKRELQAADIRLTRTEVVAELARLGYSVADVAGQSYVVGLSLRDSSPVEELRRFIGQHCIRADGLQTKLADLVRASKLRRNQIIYGLKQLGFDVTFNDSYYVVGLGLQEPCYK
jgi:hypothetical protein